MKFNPYSDMIFLTGKKSKGKSYYVRDQFLTGVKRKIVYDRNWEHTEKGYVVHNVEKLMKTWLFDDLTSIIFQPVHFTDEEFDQLCQFILKLDNLLFVVEEIHRHAHSRGYSSQAFREIVNRGRHDGIGLIGTSRRPFLIHKDIRGNVDYVICFSLHEKDDLKYMAKWMGVSEETIKKLPKWHSIFYDTETHEVYKQKPC